MALELADRELRDQRRGLLGWSIGLVFLVGIVALSWPSIDGSTDLDQLVEGYPDAVKELFGLTDPLSSPVGYLNSQLFAYFLPLLLLIYSIGKGAKTIAGDEEDGRMEMLSSFPRSRRRIVLEKALAVTAGVSMLCIVTFASLSVFAAAVGLDIAIVNLFAATVGAWLIAIAGGMVALAIGSAWGRKGIAIASVAAYFTATYLLQGLAPSVSALEWTKILSPLYWGQHGNPLRNGFDWQSLVVLGGVSTMLALIAVFGFARRDLRT